MQEGFFPTKHAAVQFSIHATQRMKERGISDQEVYDTMNAPDTEEAGRVGRTIAERDYHRYLGDRDERGRRRSREDQFQLSHTIRVVYIEETDEAYKDMPNEGDPGLVAVVITVVRKTPGRRGRR